MRQVAHSPLARMGALAPGPARTSAAAAIATPNASAASAGGPAASHPLGNFTINTATELLLTPGAIQITYVVDMAEIPAFQELRGIDTDVDGRVSDAEPLF